MFLPRRILEEKILRFLKEDLGQGDITTSLVVPKSAFVEAKVVAKADGVAAGIEEAMVLCESVGLKAEALTSDGSKIRSGDELLSIFGEARTLLSVERTLLNILSRMSGIATMTSLMVGKVRASGYMTFVACTRKTAPGLSYFDKKAVFLGAGDTHRLHLDDLVLIKNNHVKIAGSVESAVRDARETASFSKKIEVEACSTEEALQAAEAKADVIMLDNFSPIEVEDAISLLAKKNLRSRVLLEASGRITQENILEYAASGVDIISVGEITHSARSMDISLRVVKVEEKR